MITMNSSSIPRPQRRNASFGKNLASFVLAIFALWGANVTSAVAASKSVEIIDGQGYAATAAQIQAAINTCATGDTLTVTGSATIDMYGGVALNIPANVTVAWKATLIGESMRMVNISGGGTFHVMSGSITTSYTETIYVDENTTLIVSGGTVEATGDVAEAVNLRRGAKAIITGGTISSPRSKISGLATAWAYYTGDRAGMFNTTFTAGTNLFKLDGLTFTTADVG